MTGTLVLTSRFFDNSNLSVLSADVLRCLETVGPYAADAQLVVQSEPLLSESGYADQSAAALERVLGVVAMHEPVIACSQGRAMPSLVEALCTAFDLRPPADSSCRKGGGWVLHFASNGKPRLVAYERFEPLA